MLDFTPFTDSDFEDFAGSEPFPNGDKPAVCRLNTDTLVIADGNGWCRYYMFEDFTKNYEEAHEAEFKSAKDAAVILSHKLWKETL